MSVLGRRLTPTETSRFTALKEKPSFHKVGFKSEENQGIVFALLVQLSFREYRDFSLSFYVEMIQTEVTDRHLYSPHYRTHINCYPLWTNLLYRHG